MQKSKKSWTKPTVIVRGTIEQLTQGGWIPGNRKCKSRKCNYLGS